MYKWRSSEFPRWYSRQARPPIDGEGFALPALGLRVIPVVVLSDGSDRTARR